MKKSVRTVIVVLAVLLLIAAFYSVIRFSGYSVVTPFTSNYELLSPSYVVKYGDKFAVVDNGGTRIVLLDSNLKVQRILSSGDYFSKLDYVAMNSNGIYIADIENASNSNRVKHEAIQHFDYEGNHIGTVFSVDYKEGKENMPAQKGFICRLSEYQDKIYAVYSNRSYVSVYRIDAEGEKENFVLLKQISKDKVPPVWNISYSASSNRMWLVGKDSRIYRENDTADGFDLYDNGILYTGDSIYGDIHVCGDHVYAADLGLSRVIDVISGRDIITPDDGLAVYRVYGDENSISVTDQVGIALADTANGVTFYETVLDFSPDFMLKCNLVFWSYIYIALIVVVIAFLILFATFKGSRSNYKKVGVFVALTVIVSSALISSTILNDTFSRLSDSSYSELMRTAEIVSKTSSLNGIGDALNELEGIEAYGTDKYNFIKERLDIYCDAAYDNGGNMYYTLMKFDDELIWGIMDYEDTTGAVYPYLPFSEGSYYTDVALTGNMHLEEMSVDAYGAWSYVCAPIYDSSGNISGLVEFGVNMMSESMANEQLITNIIMRTAVIVLIIILALVEGTSLIEGVSGFRKEKDPNTPYFLRPMIFMTFLASNLSAAFIPQLSMKIYEENGLALFDNSLAAALPMSLQLFATAISALMCGKLLEKFNMRTIMLLSGVIQAIGYGLITLAVPPSDYIIFSLGHFISGLGIGLIIVSLNALPDQIEDAEKRNSYYASLNAGVIAGVVFGCSVGTYIAEWVGYSNTFIVSILIVAVVMYLSFISIGKGKHAVPKQSEPEFAGENNKSMATWRFLLRRDVFFFILCIMMPMLIMLYFKDYLFPLYANESGITDTNIGNILLFAGAVSIVFGTTISDWLLKRFGSEGVMLISTVIVGGSLILFGLMPSYELSVVVIFVLSLVTGFSLSAQEIYYSSLKEFKNYGAKRSMSIYSIFDNISQTVGPLIMGALLFMGYGGECFVMGVSALGLFAIFTVTRIFGKMREKAKKND